MTFRAYYEARFGRAAWDALGSIPRTLWMEYLVWYRRVLDLPGGERGGCDLGARRTARTCWRSICDARAAAEQVLARHARAGDRARRARRSVRAGDRAPRRPAILGALGGRHRFCGVARQACRRGRRRRFGDGQCGDGAGGRRRSPRPVHPPPRHPAHQQVHRHRQPRRRARVRGAARRVEVAIPALRAGRADAAAARQHAAGVAASERPFPPRQPDPLARAGRRCAGRYARRRATTDWTS